MRAVTAEHRATTRTLVITSPRSELGAALSEQAGAVAAALAAPVLLSVASQPPNTLLHDGHAWKSHTPARIVADARRAVTAARRARASLLVHASYAFLRAAEPGGRPGDRLRPIVDAGLEAEAIVLDAGVAASVVRLGYLYGQRSRDLRAYRRAFRLGRPYWAGPTRRRHDFLHVDDAVRALLRAAQQARTSGIHYATDGHPLPFATFMDYFARRVGNRLPLRLPAISRPFSHLVVAEEHMQMVELGVSGPARPQVRGFRPRFADYRAGIDQIVDSWG